MRHFVSVELDERQFRAVVQRVEAAISFNDRSFPEDEAEEDNEEEEAAMDD